MSEQVSYKGKLKKITDKNLSLEEQCKSICKSHNINSLGWHDSYIDVVRFDLDDDYTISNNEIYKILEKKSYDDFEWCIVKKNSDGTYDFDVSYYNGGCSFEEAIENGFDDLDD
jgi:hypothetical protein